MKAIWYEQLGPARDVLQYGVLPSPTPQAGEVLVRLHASGINPSDVKMRGGARVGNASMPFPQIVPHSDGAGVIEAVGEGVNADRIGERVWVSNAQWQRAFGTAAEYIALPEGLTAPLPEGVSFEVGASLGIPAITACHSVFSHGSVQGLTVLISGGAGTVGYLAVQLARMAGAHVIATAGGEHGISHARDAGAHHALDYNDPELAQQILAANGGRPVDRIVEVEFGSNVATNAAVIKERGHLVTYGSAKAQQPELPFYPLMFKGITLEFVLVYLLTVEERQAQAALINHALSSNLLRVPIHSSHPMADAAHAHEVVEAGRRGSVILNIE